MPTHPQPLTSYRLQLRTGEPLELERSALFYRARERAEAEWYVDGTLVCVGETFDHEWREPGTYRLTAAYDGRRVHRVVEVGLDLASLLDGPDEFLYCLVAKHRGKLLFLTVRPGSAARTPGDVDDDARAAVLAEQRAKEPAAYDYASRQNDQWACRMLSQPLLRYDTIREGVYILTAERLYLLGPLGPLADEFTALKTRLRHDATVDEAADARPHAVYEQVNAIAAAFDPAVVVEGLPARVLPTAFDDGGQFERWATANINAVQGHVEDYFGSFGVDLGADRIAPLFVYNTDNFLFSTRFSDPSLGLSRQFTNVVGFGDPTAGDSAGLGEGTAGGLVPGRTLLDDGEGLLLGFAPDGSGGRVQSLPTPGSSVYADGDPNYSGPLVGPFTPDGDDADPDGDKSVTPAVPGSWSSIDGGGGVEYDVYNTETGEFETWRYYHEDYLTGEDDDPDERTPDDTGGGETGGDDDTGGEDGGEGGDDAGDDDTGGDDSGDGDTGDDTGGDTGDDTDDDDTGDEGEGEDDEPDDDPEPSSGGVAVTPADDVNGGGSSGGSLPGTGLTGTSGGCRGGGYTCPSEEYDGSGGGVFRAFNGAVCPMGPEERVQFGTPQIALDPNDGTVDPAPDTERLGRELFEAIPVVRVDDVAGGGGRIGTPAAVEIVGMADDLRSGRRLRDDVVPDGGTESGAGAISHYHVLDRTTAYERGHDLSARIVGDRYGWSTTGLFGFAGEATCVDADKQHD